jgi:RHS repeat-associated protein
MNQENNNQDQKDTGYSKNAAPSISLPKGGGAMKGIDEKFTVNAVNGTAGMSLPFPMGKTRSDFAPGLGVSYNSGAGNSEFGLGWSGGLGGIQRKTDKQLPTYNDLEECDVFLFAGAEDLVLKYEANIAQKNIPFPTVNPQYLVSTYIPRIEGMFARIQRIQKVGETHCYWKVTTPDNVTTYFGYKSQSRLCDPKFPDRIFKWMPDISYDDKGNVYVVDYKAEDLINVPQSPHEENRLSGLQPFTNIYLKSVRYGNHLPYYEPVNQDFEPSIPSPNFHFFYATVLDYGEYDTSFVNPTPDPKKNDLLIPEPTNLWPCRKDPFSDYHAGFEIRTYRLCKRVLCFSNFIEHDPLFEINPTSAKQRTILTQSLDLTFQYESAIDKLLETDYIIKAQQFAYRKISGQNTYEKKGLPAIELQYQEPEWNTKIETVSKENLENDPVGLNNPYQWMDFYGEGISGIITEQAQAWWYKSNEGNAAFTPAQKIAEKPNFGGLGSILQWQDLAADGRRQVVSQMPGVQGFWELNDDDNWSNFSAFTQLPNINFGDPDTRMLDLSGDGKPDILITQENVFTMFANKGKAGYAKGITTTHVLDENKGPAILFADGTQSIFLADINGDGLTDIVRIRNKSICYWPNLGYGRFGAKVTMSNAPVFDHPDQFNPAYIHLSDVNGTGATDIIYLGKNQFKAWLNLSGNGWSEPKEINPFPSTELPNTLSVVDLLGNGTSCLVWSSPLPSNAQAPMRYINLMGGKKPYLLKFYKNNAGKEITMHYKSSTFFYLQDKHQGTPWVTKLPFPVHCLQSVSTHDVVSGTTYSNSYSYHHGYYDHAEREFRGFGRVDTLDTEVIEEFILNNGNTVEPTTSINEPPILTKTWYHTGAWMGIDNILTHYKHEYFKPELHNTGVFTEKDLVQPLLDPIWTPLEQRQALRALKGVALRQEVYSQDGSTKQHLPYSTTEHNYHIQQFQPSYKNPFAVYLVHEQESLAYSYERNAADPRIAHSLTLQLDEYGHVLQAASVVYPRINNTAVTNTEVTIDAANLINEEQAKTHIIFATSSYTTNEFLNSIGAFRMRLPMASQSWELTGVTTPNTYFSIDELLTGFDGATEIDYTTIASGNAEKRCIESQKAIYLADNTTAPLAYGLMDTLALPYQQFRLAFADDVLKNIYNANGITRITDADLTDAKYVKETIGTKDYYWIPSGTVEYPPNPKISFYNPSNFLDPWGNISTVEFYSDYYLFVHKTKNYITPQSATAPVEIITTIDKIDWRTLQPLQTTDANLNISQMAYDILGMPTGMAILGKNTNGISEADDLIGFNADISPADKQAFFADPVVNAPNLLQHATARYIYDYESLPLRVATIVREQHHAIDPNSPLQLAFEYSDGFGRLLMKKVQAEPGDFSFIDNNNTLQTANSGSALRWVGNGRTILNNKSKPIKQYEPYFSGTHVLETNAQLVEVGYSPIMYYDAAGRLVKTVMPDGTYSHVVFDAWKQTSYDANDNVIGSQWADDRSAGGALVNIPQEVNTLTKTLAHANTPTTIYLDSLGRSFFTKQNDFINNKIFNYSVFNIESNITKIIDARENVSMKYQYDMLGNIIYQKQIDAGESFMLKDVFGKVVYSFDGNHNRNQLEYDQLHRPISKSIAFKNGLIWNKEQVLERTFYGEGLPNDQLKNVRGNVYSMYDGAGKTTINEYDFKGNPKATIRTFVKDPTVRPDWKIIANVPLETNNNLPIEYSSIMMMNALNMPISIMAPDGSITTNTYKAAQLFSVFIDNVHKLSGDIVLDIAYNAKGQREKITYANNTITSYNYDAKTYRLTNCKTLRTTDGVILQDMYYWYDPTGNITMQTDAAQPDFVFDNDATTPTNAYTYDALYRLIEATGREFVDTATNNPNYTSYNDRLQTNKTHANDFKKRKSYTQKYRYDGVGNILETKHITTKTTYNWTRKFTYDALSNKLLQTNIGSNGISAENYIYDTQGNLTGQLNHLTGKMTYNHENRLENVAIAKDITAYYQYDASGSRIRKTIVNNNNNTTETRKYLGNFEVYTKFTASNVVLERETIHIADDSGVIALIDTPLTTNNIDDMQLLRYQYANQIKSCGLELDADGMLISFEEYYPYGSTSYQAGRNTTEVQNKRYRYVGKERDEETGLYYIGARYYAPWLCRWCATDPILQEFYNYNAGQPHRNTKRNYTEIAASSYEYCYDNPVMFNDLSGEQVPLMKESDRTNENKPKVSNIDETFVFIQKPLDTYGPSAKDGAILSTHVYGEYTDKLLEETAGWKISELGSKIKLSDDAIGFNSKLYERILYNGEIEYCYVTQGTNFTSKEDWLNNLRQPIGMSEQYKLSMENAKKLVNKILPKNAKLSFAGHSLGGGMAAANAYTTGGNAMTYNAAGVGLFTVKEKRKAIINAYVLSTDPLNKLQDALSIAPNVDGKRHTLRPTDVMSILNGHSILSVLKNYKVDGSKYLIRKPFNYRPPAYRPTFEHNKG